MSDLAGNDATARMDTHVIERLGHLGDGIARGPVYAPRTLPGEEIAGEVVAGRIERPRILHPSGDRVSPPCPHYNACGACALMHAKDTFVAAWKAGVVEQALSAQGIEARVESVSTSPPGSRRRATLHARRTKSGALVGFHGRASAALTAIDACRVLDPAIRGALPVLERMAVLGASRKGMLDIAVIAGTEALDISVTGGKPLDPSLSSELTALLSQAGVARLTWSGELVFQTVPPAIDMGGLRLVPPPGAFLQATPHGEAALRMAVEEIVADADRVVDLFAGCGTFALPLSRRMDVHAVEGHAPPLAALRDGWRAAAGGHAVTVETRDLFRDPLRPDEIDRFDAVVIDPPRAGAEAQMRGIARSRVRRVASVSCDPVTFARDAAILVAAGFALQGLRVVDQFRWSPHVEIVAGFARGTASRQ